VSSEILSKGEAEAMMAAPKFKKVAIGITNEHMKAIEKVVGTLEVLACLDQSGISHKGYVKFFNTVENGVKLVDKNLRFKALPTPFHVSNLPICLRSQSCSE
jgi:hypothetical protein